MNGLVCPPAVVKDEESAAPLAALFARFEVAGVSLKQISGLVSDGAHAPVSHLQQALPWVHQKRCVWHLGGRIAPQMKAVIVGFVGETAESLAEQVRDSLGGTPCMASTTTVSPIA